MAVERPGRPNRALPPTPALDADATSHPAGNGVPGIQDDPLSSRTTDKPAAANHAPRSPTAARYGTRRASTHDTVPAEDVALTPIRAHYLKKTLMDIQFTNELMIISTPPADPAHSTLSYLGAPFSAPQKGQLPNDTPFLRFMFRQFVLTFPFLSAAPPNFFPAKLQPFVSSVLARNITSPSVMLEGGDGDEVEQATRRKMFQKLEKHLGLVLGAATKVTEKEEVVRLSQRDLDRLEELARRRRRRAEKGKQVFEVNIVAVRTVIAKGRVRSRAHEEFVVRTRRTDFPDIFVSRRYGDFKTLAEELRKAHPGEAVRSPPEKDRSAATFSSSPAKSAFRGMGMAMYTSPAQQDSDESLPNTPSASATFASPLSREKNRLTLRAYLHSLLASPTLASSPVLRSFLTAGPIALAAEEEEDAKRREEADRVREEGRRTFAREVASRVEGLRDAVRGVKGNLMAKDGLTGVFAMVKTTSDVKALPPDYQAVLAWGRISLAATIFQNFVASDTSSETLAGLKRIHGLMPYFMLKGVLKISNPMAMIRGVLDLFLAQPFGGRSLLQRMFSSSLTEEVKAIEEDIAAVKEKIQDDVLCDKIRMFVDAPPEIQSVYKADAAAENLNLIAVILRSADGPALSRAQFHRVVRASRSHAAYTRHRASQDDSDDDMGPQDEDGWLFEDLGVLMRMYARLRDREQLLALIFEGSTAELLKDIITIFYSPLAQVYKAASIADSLGDLQNFLNDLIKTVESVEELSQEDPQRTVQIFIDLVQRHEQAFYSFVHRVHSKGEGLFDGLMKWIELFMDLMREGLGDRVSLEFLLPHNPKDRAEILKEVDQVARYHYRLKLAYEEKLRRRFGNNNDGADGEDEIARDLVDGVVRDLSFGELVKGGADEIAAEESDSESEEDDSDMDDDDESGSEEEESDESSQAHPPSAPPPPPPKVPLGHALSSRLSANERALSQTGTVRPSAPRQNSEATERSVLPSTGSGGRSMPLSSSPERLPIPPSHRSKPAASDNTSPELTHIPALVPLFVEMVRPQLRPRAL